MILKQFKTTFPISIWFQVSIFGIYHLTEVDGHYKEYLLAMDIPHTAAEIITKMQDPFNKPVKVQLAQLEGVSLVNRCK